MDGTAILIAVIVVAGVGSFVDWRKEIEFVNRSNEGQAANKVRGEIFRLKIEFRLIF